MHWLRRLARRVEVLIRKDRPEREIDEEIRSRLEREIEENINRGIKEDKSVSSMEVTPEERHELIAVAAYRRAELRGFAPGRELQDWMEAEAEIDESLRESTAS